MIENQNDRYVLGTNRTLKIKVEDELGAPWIPTTPLTWSYKMTNGTSTLALTQATISYAGGVASIPILGSATSGFTAGDYDQELIATDNSIPTSVMRGIMTCLKVIA